MSRESGDRVPEEAKKFISPEHRWVTFRSYEEYLSYFCLPESELAGKRILDIGSGLSGFAKKAAEKFEHTGTTVVALDPVYEDLGEDIQEFRGNIEKAGMEIKPGVDVEKKYKEIISTPGKVAGSHQDLPIREGSVDLVLANNSITQYKDRILTKRVLKEISQVLTPNGEVRIQPADLAWDKNKGDFYVHTFERPTPETRMDAEEQGVVMGPDREMFKILKEFEKLGFTLYATVSINLKKGPFSRPRFKMAVSVIARKDNQIPKVENLYELYKLSFKNSPDDFHVSSLKVPLETARKEK